MVMIFVGRLLQRMEFDADRYEALMVGSTVFESTCYSLQYLGGGYEESFSMLKSFMRQKKLGDNLPKLIVLGSRKLSDEKTREIVEEIQKPKEAGLTDSHPPDSQRIARVREENQPGIFHVDAPTSALFNNFDQLCKNVTWDVYRRFFGANFSPQQMRSMDELIEQHEEVQKKTEKAEERFAGVFHSLRPLPNVSVFPNEECDREQRLSELKNARDRLASLQKHYFQARSEFDRADKEMTDAEEGIAALTCLMYYPDGSQLHAQNRHAAIHAKKHCRTKVGDASSNYVASRRSARRSNDGSDRSDGVRVYPYQRLRIESVGGERHSVCIKRDQ